MGTAQTLALAIAEAGDTNALHSLQQCNMVSAWSLSQWQQVFAERYTVVVARQDACIVGVAVLATLLDEAELELVVVDANQRGHGIGKALLGFGLEQLGARIRRIHLEVDAANITAVKLYQALQFTVTATRKGYYTASPGNGDALLMTKLIHEV